MRRFLVMSLILFIIIAITSSGVGAQDNSIVPDLTGISVPVAAATLNEVGLQMGTETPLGWTAESGLPENSIFQQSISPGETAAYGTVIDVTVLRSPNAVLIYDDNDITLVNQSNGAIALGNLSFNSANGSASFRGGRWAAQVNAGDCAQLWSIGRTGAKDLPECDSIRWLTTNNPAEHFWTGADGSSEFTVNQAGINRATCPVSTQGRCEFFLVGAGSSEFTEYIYVVYTIDRFQIMNNTTDQWMSLDGTLVSGAVVGPGTAIVDESFFDDEVNVVGYVHYLAPGQCILYTNHADGAPALQPCKEIGRASFNVDAPLFWNMEFSLLSVNDSQSHTCPAAAEGRMTICIMPR